MDNINDPFLWRYMSFPAFISIITTGKMTLSPLISFDDPFEAHIPLLAYQKRLDRLFNAERNHEVTDFQFRYAHYLCMRRNLFVNCWHDSPGESAAMWKLYGSDYGIAVRCRRSSLVRHFERECGTANLSHRHVEYEDNLQNKLDMEIRDMAFYKRVAFRHENEYRFVYFCGESFGKDTGILPSMKTGLPDNIVGYLKGRQEPMAIPFSMNGVIEEILVSPLAPQWHCDAVNAVMEKFGISPKARRSTLADAPVM